MSKVAIVTDSTTYLPAEIIKQYPIRVLPLTLHLEGREYDDGVDITASEFYKRMAGSDSVPTTSQVNSQAFEQAFEELLNEGYEIITLLISSGLSATFQSALQAKKKFEGAPVELMDSRLVAMALGLQVLAVARAAEKGASLAECKALAENVYNRIGVYFTVESLTYLHRGGRIGGAKRLLGTALNIKPILEIRDGLIMPRESVISQRKALRRMITLAEKDLAGRKAQIISVFHAAAPELAQDLLASASELLQPEETIFTEVSPVIGAHTGPGTVALTYLAAED